jgi:hypothetical protein
MRSRKTPITRLVALGLIAGAAAAPVASAHTASWSERAADVAPAEVSPSGGAPAPECAAWQRAMSLELAQYGIVGAQADSYLASRLDDPCHQPITLRSLFHAGDPGVV